MSNADKPAVLVTGATGFLGHNLVPVLLDAGYHVRAFVRRESDVSWLRGKPIELVTGDVSDLSSVSAAAQGCRYVVHAAGRFRFWGTRSKFQNINVDGTHNTLEAARRAGVEKFIHISTVVAVGKPQQGRVIDEHHPLDPQDAYQRSKARGEDLANEAYRQHGLPVVILRPGAFYGPWGRYAFNRLFFEDPLHGLLIKVKRGRLLTFPVYIKDVAAGIVAALERARPGETYNLSGESITHNQANAIVSRLAGLTTFRFNVPRAGMVGLGWLMTQSANVITHQEPFYPLNLAHYVFHNWAVSSEKARRELGFTPISFEEGARLTLAWYRKMGVWQGEQQPWEVDDA